MSAIYLSEGDLEGLVDMRTAVEVIEEAFRRLALGEVENVPRARARAPGIVLHTMSAAAAYSDLVGLKCYTTTRGGGKFLIALFDAQTGSLLTMMEADQIGQVRTAATTGVAIRYLAPRDISQLGLFGTGWQARSQLAAAAVVRPIRTAFVYGRDADRRRRFADEMSHELNIDVRAVDQPQQAAENLPLVITATTSREPVVFGKWLAEGTMVCAIGSNWLNRAEIDVDTVARAGAVVCDSVAACKIEAGDFTAAIEQNVFKWSQAVELSDIVAGRVSAQNRPGVTVFKSVGLAIEDVALGGKLWEVARRQGLGQTLPF